MSDRSAISWCDATWNPVRGCMKVSAGCKNCYAERFSERFRGVKGHPFEQGFDVRLVPEALDFPLHWRKPRRIFVNSMSDLFHPEVPDEFILSVIDVIRRCSTERPGHVFLTLTKRPERMRNIYARLRFDGYGDRGLWLSDREARNGFAAAGDGYALTRALENLWSGVSVEDQPTADKRVSILLDTPAAHRFVSLEPLLGPIDLRPFKLLHERHGILPAGLDWVIVGGESGPKARPCDMEWIRSIVRQCKSAGVPCFVKQLGTEWRRINSLRVSGWHYGTRNPIHDRAGRDPSEWPADLRVQQFPEEMTK